MPHPLTDTPERQKLTFGGQSTYALTLQRNGCTRHILMLDVWRKENAIDGRYVRLPVEWEEGKPVVRWRDRWTLADMDKLPATGRETVSVARRRIAPPYFATGIVTIGETSRAIALLY